MTTRKRYTQQDGKLVHTQGNQVEISYRLEPCRCGCQGQDPWHQKSYWRVIKDEKPASGKVRTKAFGIREIIREGRAQLPWGQTRVVAIEDRHGAGLMFWAIDYDDMLDVQNS